MICSKCRYNDADGSEQLIRYLCVEGHLLCVACMRQRKDRPRKCPVCGGKIVKKLNVNGIEVPRIEIKEVTSCSSLNLMTTEDVIQLEPCKPNFQQLESIEGIEPPLHYDTSNEIGDEPFLIDLSSDESHIDILRNGRTYFRRDEDNEQPEINETPKNYPNMVSSSQFPFKVSFDSVEINKDPRERQICNLYDTLPPEHEHVIAVNSYNEPCALPYIVLEREEGGSREAGVSNSNFIQNMMNQENVLQFFRVVNDSYETINPREETIPSVFAIIPTRSTGVRSENHNLLENNQDTLIRDVSKDPEPSTHVPSITSLSISRAPIACPISTCSKIEFKSNVIKHIQTDHPQVVLETIASGIEKSHLWDTRVNKRDTRKCHVVYLVKDRIRDLGSSEFKDYLPLILMTTKFKASSLLFDDSFEEEEKSHFMIWVTGLSVKEVPVYYTLTLHPAQMETPGSKIIFCNEVYSWRNEQTPKALYESGNALLLTHQQYSRLTSNGDEMIRMKIVID